MHVIADGRPVVISKLVRPAAVPRAAGACMFSWTDEWGVARESVDGWSFGLTTAAREPKPALDVVEDWALRDLGSLRPT